MERGGREDGGRRDAAIYLDTLELSHLELRGAVELRASGDLRP